MLIVRKVGVEEKWELSGFLRCVLQNTRIDMGCENIKSTEYIHLARFGDAGKLKAV